MSAQFLTEVIKVQDSVDVKVELADLYWPGDAIGVDLTVGHSTTTLDITEAKRVRKALKQAIRGAEANEAIRAAEADQT